MNPLRSSLASRNGILLISSILLVLSSEPRWFSSTANLLPPVSDSLDTPASAWQAPLALVPGIDSVSRWPWMAYAVVAAGIITLQCRQGSRTFTPLLMAWALSLGVEPLDVVPAAALAMLALADAAIESGKPGFVGLSWIALGILLALLGTLEFGLVLVVALGILLSPRASTSNVPARRHRNGFIAAIAILPVVGLALYSPGFRHCLLRPVNWVSASLHPDLLPKLSPAYRALDDWETALLLVGLAAAWAETARARNISLWRLVPMSLLTVLGVGCLHYLWLSTFAAAVLCSETSSTTARSTSARSAIACFFASALLVFGARTDWLTLLAGDVAPHRIDPSAWKLRGPVMLLDLDKSTSWQAGDARNRHRLVIDDRWDIHGHNYEEYALVCHDLRHARQHSYLRTDGSWGGYARWLKLWQPIMLVADPADEVALRRLSLSPDWRIMGMDGAQVVFGRSGDPTTLPLMTAALNCLLTLEWPANVDQLNVEATIVARTPEDRRTTAGVLCAMRLPYAALRFLRGDDSLAADRQRTACYVELAHRVRSHSGTPSLLDQFRAVSGIRRLAASSLSDRRERRRLAHHLIGLGLNGLARELFPEAFPVAGESGLDVEDVSGIPGGAADASRAADPQQQIRIALAEANETDIHRLLPELSEPDRSYYSIFTNSLDRNAEEIRNDFDRFLSRFPDLTAAMRAEALFYQGCAALEAGDTGQAILALRQSEELAPDLPQRAIRRTFLIQLTAPRDRAAGPP